MRGIWIISYKQPYEMKRRIQTTNRNEGARQLNTPITKTKPKRPSKGMRKHNRKVKQEARRINVPGSELNSKKRP
jgi:hypothetical protein